MTKILITADIHYGITRREQFAELQNAILTEQPDVVLVAGDIGEGLQNIQDCLRGLQCLACPVGIIAGNHDLWLRDYEVRDSAQLMEVVLPELVRDHKLHWLETDVLKIGNLAITGTVGWYDYSYRIATSQTAEFTTTNYERVKRLFNNDARFVYWADNRTDVEYSNILGEALETRLAKLEDDPTVHEVLVITHVPAFIEQMVSNPNDHPIAASYFGNMTLGNRLLKYPKVRTVVSGHTHREVPVQTIQAGGREMTIGTVGSDYHAPKFISVTVDAKSRIQFAYIKPGDDFFFQGARFCKVSQGTGELLSTSNIMDFDPAEIVIHESNLDLYTHDQMLQAQADFESISHE